MLDQLKKIGIEGSIVAIDNAPWIAKMKKGEYAISVTGDSERLDPDDAYYMRIHSSEIGKSNWPRCGNKELGELLDKSRADWFGYCAEV